MTHIPPLTLAEIAYINGAARITGHTITTLAPLQDPKAIMSQNVKTIEALKGLDDAQLDALIDGMDSLDKYETQIKQNAEALAAALNEKVTAENELEAKTILVGTLEEQVNIFRTRIEAMGDYTNPFQAQVQEEGTCGQIPAVDPVYTVPGWVSAYLDPMLSDASNPIIALTGPAGIGKTLSAEQLCARKGLRMVLLNCKGQDPFAFIESQELRNGETKRMLGILAEAIQSPNTVIVLDEIDTADPVFQSLILTMLEVEPHRRRLTTQGNGIITVAQGVRFILTLNNVGMHCSSRHRGALLPPLQNRISGCAGWVAVPMPEDSDLSRIFMNRHVTVTADYAKKIARTTLALIRLANEGAIDCDVSIRTGLGVCRSAARFGIKSAWRLALLDGIDDPTQKAAAITTISTQFPDDFKPVG